MNIISAFYRKIIAIKALLFSFLRVTHLKLSYPNLSIDYKTIIESNCKIECDNMAKMILKKCYISSGTYISAKHSGELNIIGSFIGRNSVIVSANKINIKSNCLIAEMVVIRDHDHSFSEQEIPINEQGLTTSPILINENVWLANKVSVLKGVTIGEKTVVGAHTVVNKSIEPNGVVAGIPARSIKK